jgi:malonyl-CoA/methylmalonyl-CoA synthetase
MLLYVAFLKYHMLKMFPVYRETCADVFNPKWFWERISQGGVSVFSIAPEGYDRLAEYFDEHIATLPPAHKERYIHGITAVRFAGVTGSLLLPQTQQRWTELRGGKPLLNLYGSTEVMLICSMRWENPHYSHMVTSSVFTDCSAILKCILVLRWISSAGS